MNNLAPRAGVTTKLQAELQAPTTPTVSGRGRLIAAHRRGGRPGRARPASGPAPRPTLAHCGLATAPRRARTRLGGVGNVRTVPMISPSPGYRG